MTYILKNGYRSKSNKVVKHHFTSNSKAELPQLWILTPSASDRLLKLPSQEAVSLVLQCTREELLERLTDN